MTDDFYLTLVVLSRSAETTVLKSKTCTQAFAEQRHHQGIIPDDAVDRRKLGCQFYCLKQQFI